jgi:flagellar biosynthesis protein FlhG
MSTPLVTEEQPALDTIVLDGNAPTKAIWPIAGGKGGTGKSTLTANMGVGLSLLGYKVILVDCDLGGADLHLFFDQIAPARSLSHFLTKETASLKDVLLPTPSENLKIICGGNEMVGLANLPYMVKEKLLRHIMTLDADFVLIDLGAGTTFNTLDFFTLSNDGLIVCTPEPHARVDAYGFIKNTVYRKLRRLFSKNDLVKTTIEQFARKAGRKSGRISELLDLIDAADAIAGETARATLANYRPRLILNRVRYKRQIEEAHRFQTLVKEYLSTEMKYVGYVRSDIKILDACERRRPLMIDNPKAPAARDLYTVLMQGLQIPDRLHRFDADNSRKMAEVAKLAAKYW